MGASGIEGTMRRSCEVTMTMLRDQRQIIITLLQVLLYDPLFTWTITPEKACKMQSEVVKGFSESGRGKKNQLEELISHTSYKLNILNV